MSRESNTPYFIQSSSFRSLLSPVFFRRFKVKLKLRSIDPTCSPSFLSRSWVCCDNSVIGKGIEPHPTNGHTQNNLSIDIETHDAFTISDTLSCRSSEAGFAISPHSLPILYQNLSIMSSFFSFYFNFFITLSSLLFNFFQYASS